MYCSIPLEYTIRGDVVMVAYTSNDVTYGSSLILIKGCRISVRAVTTYVVSLVEHVVAQVVTYNMAYVVGCFVLNFVVVICKCFCKWSCSTIL